MIILSGCHFKDAPAEVEIPLNSDRAICDDGENIYTFVYKNDGVYQYSINDIVQSESILDNIQEQVYLHNESVQLYLNDIFTQGQCIYDSYAIN